MKSIISKTTKRRVYDPENMNDRRALFATEAIRKFQEETGSDDCDAIGDLLCDLMHLCDRFTKFGKYKIQANRALLYYQEETAKSY